MEIDVTAQQNELISREFGNGNEPVKSHINSVEKQEGSACVREEQQPVAIASQCKEDVEVSARNHWTTSGSKSG